MSGTDPSAAGEHEGFPRQIPQLRSHLQAQLDPVRPGTGPPGHSGRQRLGDRSGQEVPAQAPPDVGQHATEGGAGRAPVGDERGPGSRRDRRRASSRTASRGWLPEPEWLLADLVSATDVTVTSIRCEAAVSATIGPAGRT